MKPPAFAYARPGTLEGAVALLADAGSDPKVIAGGQSLVPMLNFRLAGPGTLVDIALIEGLNAIRRDGRSLVLGAGVRQRVAELSPLIGELCPMLPLALAQVGHLQIRNRGTVGGSIAHADPAAELPAVVVALGAELRAVSVRGDRTIAGADFFLGPYATALAEDELLTEVRFPIRPEQRVSFLEVARRSGDFALAGLATAVEVSSDGAVTAAELVAFGVAGMPVRLEACCRVLEGRKLDMELAAECGRLASAAVDPISGVHADAAYRRALVGNLVKRGLMEVMS